LRARVTSSLEKKHLRDLEVLRAQQLQREKDRLEKTQQRLDKELADAANYVRSTFPAPCRTPLAVDWIYQPSTELAGDAFGYHWIDAEHFAVYLLDVCGHGVGACLLSVAAINTIRSGSLAHTDFRDPAAVLKALGNVFLIENQNNMYFTLWSGVFNTKTRILQHASGGHPAALLLTEGSDGMQASQQLRSPGLIVGMMEDMPYDTLSCPVPPGARLVVLCDGCFEIMDKSGTDATFEDFERMMQASGAAHDGLEQAFKWAKDLHGEGPLDDDFSIVRIQF
jgi:sigma-B regulation protein RsbU (phosphoserine phosphatase)